MSNRSTHAGQGLAFLVEDRPAEAFEQLDAVLQIVSVRSWCVLAVIFFMLLSFGVFSCVYKAPLKVDGRGIILSKYHGDDAPLQQVTAPATGRLKRVLVKIGAEVDAGQALAEIDQSDLWDQFDEADAELANLIQDDRVFSELDDAEALLRARALAKLEDTLLHNLTLDERRLLRHRGILSVDRDLQRKRYINDLDAQKNQTEADAVESAIGDIRAKLDELKFNQREDINKRQKEKARRTLDIEKAKTKLALISNRLERDTRLVSAYRGTVIDLMITEHALVEKGAVAALLRPEGPVDPPMEAIVFVPAGLGKKIQESDEVEVSPDTIRRQEHGFVHGVVSKISELPATEAAMLAELKHKNLVSSFAGQYSGQVLLFIHVDLKEEPGAREPARVARLRIKNRLAWSSSSGARQNVSTGTLCAASIVVERQPLIVLAFPWVKKLVGIY
jgi:HlyD family secretion protein